MKRNGPGGYARQRVTGQRHIVPNVTSISESLGDVRRPAPDGLLFERRALLVLGMHRSGTSAVTRVLSLLGAGLPTNLMLPKVGNNEAGFWESLDAYALNDEILASAGSGWDDWRAFNNEWFRSPSFGEFKSRALQLLDREFADSSLFVLKDPRICRLVPFWVEVIREYGAKVDCVLPLRNPLEVAASLQRRDGFGPAKGYALWLRHVLDAERATRKLPRVFVQFDGLLEDWRTTAKRIGNELSLVWPRQSALAELEIDRFLNERHRHHWVGRSGIEHRPDVAGWVRTASKALARLVSDPHAKKAQHRLDKVRQEFDRASLVLGSVLLEEELGRQAVERRVEVMEHDAAGLRAELERRDVRIGELDALVPKLGELEAAVVSLNANVEEREGRISNFEAYVAEQQSTIEKLSGSLGERDRKILTLESEVEQLQAAGDEARKVLIERRDEITRLEQSAAAREQATDELRQLLDEREARLGLLEAESADRDAQLEDSQAAVAERDARIETLAKELGEYAGQADELRTGLAERDRRIAAIETELGERAAQVDELRSALAGREALLVVLHEAAGERAAQSKGLQASLARSNGRISALTSENNAQAQMIGELRDGIAARDGRISTLEDISSSHAALVDELRDKLAESDRLFTLTERKRTSLETVLRETSVKVAEKKRLLGERDATVDSMAKQIEDREKQARLADLRRAELTTQRNRAVAQLNVRQRKRRYGLVAGLLGRSRHGANAAPALRMPPSSCCGLSLTRKQRAAIRRLAAAIVTHRLFDESWYIAQYPDVVLEGSDPLWHWITVGCSQGLDPNPLFDTDWYLARNPDVARNGMNPLEHFLRFGGKEKRDPHPLFDTAWYAEARGLEPEGELNPLVHYLGEPEDTRISPHPLFDAKWYREGNPDVAHAGVDPLVHYLSHGAEEGRDPHPLFQTVWYRETNSDIARSEVNPLLHYTTHGWRERRKPNPLFDTGWYLEHNSDVADAGIDPLVHYIKYGTDEGRDPNPFFDTDWYLDTNPDLRGGGAHPLAHYLWHGGRERRDPGPVFNTEYYLKRHPEAGAGGANPLVHFLDNGGEPSDLSEIWPDYSALRGAGRFLSGAGQQSGFQPSERFIVHPGSFSPTVTVVVPNYNHAPYLRQRLDCIYAQTYPNYRVLLLDDCSSDNSREVLEEYRERYPERTTLLFNEHNSGGVFHQWRRGVEQSDSELVWIAESDDYCDPNFLEELVPYFMDEAVQLAYSRSVFVDHAGRPSGFAFENYLAELSPVHWKGSYVATAHDEVSRYLGRKNTIPNVSSAIFRKPDLAPLLQDDSWLSMKICGDWIFYLHVLKGGKVAFSADTSNYFRFHDSNSSAKTYSTPTYYKEHEAVACEIARHYNVPAETLEANRFYVERFFNENATALIASDTGFDEVFDSERVLSAREHRLPNVLMAAFGLSTGGGEVFPIRLANYLKKRGYPITFFNFMGDVFNPAIRRMLRPDIPLIERNEWCPDVPMLLEQFGIDVVHSHHASVDVYFASHARHDGYQAYKHVVTMHGMYEAMTNNVFNTTMSKLGDEVSTWVYIAEKNLQPFRSRGLSFSGRFTKIPNGMERPEISPVPRSEHGLTDDAFVLCLASRAIPEKGWRVAVDIVGRAREMTGTDIQLLLIGDGPVYEEMSREDVPVYVHLLGFRENVIDFYAASDLGILPTTFPGESFPLSIIECFMAGKPMLVSDVGEVRNMMTSGESELAGDLIDVSGGEIDVEQVAKQMMTMMLDPSVYGRRAALAAALAERFDMVRVGEKYEAAFAHNTP